MAKNLKSIEKDIQAAAQKLNKLRTEKTKLENKLFLEIGKTFFELAQENGKNFRAEEVLNLLKGGEITLVFPQEVGKAEASDSGHSSE